MLSLVFVLLVGVAALFEGQHAARPHIDETSLSVDELHSLPTVFDENVKQAVRKAANYILKEGHSDYSWGASTARAVVALMFAKKVRPLDKNERNLMKKQLTVQLYLDLMQEQKLSLSHLALSINALYAMCEDPRNFQGMDLVKLLRRETDSGPKSNSSSPLVFLTLCAAGESENGDLKRLSQMYAIAQGSNSMGYRALALTTLICMKRSAKDFTKAAKIAEVFEGYEEHFFSAYPNVVDSSFDIYSKSLFVQAANAAGRRTNITKLLQEQLEDGSFGDLLATYHTIPALLGASLLNLKCRTSNMHTGENFVNEPKRLGKNGKNVSVSIWITSDGIPNSHSLVLNFGEGDTLYDVLRKAEVRDAAFRFMWERTAKGMEVYDLAGIPNDAESGRSWTLYSGKSDMIQVNSKRSLREETHGIELRPKEGYSYIFWWKS